MAAHEPSKVDFSSVADMLTVGILDGISHQSGADYYIQMNEQIQSQCQWKFAGNSSRSLMFSVNLEEYVAYLTAGRMDLVCDLLADGALRLKQGGADFLVIASNTGHMAYERIRQLVPHMPILHIADCCAQKCREHGITKVGIVGTFYTSKQNYIKKRLKRHGIDVVTPSTEQSNCEMERIIEKELSFGVFTQKSRSWMLDLMIKDLIQSQKAQSVILGCTEIGLLISQSDFDEHYERKYGVSRENHRVRMIDSAKEHIRCAVDLQLKRRNIHDFEPLGMSLL